MVGSSFPVLNPDFARRLRGLSREDRGLQLQREHDMMNAVISGVAMIHFEGMPGRALPNPAARNLDGGSDARVSHRQREDGANNSANDVPQIDETNRNGAEPTFERAQGGARIQSELSAYEHLLDQIHQSVSGPPQVDEFNRTLRQGIEQILHPDDGPDDGSAEDGSED